MGIYWVLHTQVIVGDSSLYIDERACYKRFSLRVTYLLTALEVQ